MNSSNSSSYTKCMQHKSSRSFRHESPFCEHVWRMPSNGTHLIHFVCISWITISYAKESWMYLLNTPFGIAKRANWASEMRKLDSKKSANWDAQKCELILKSVNWHWRHCKWPISGGNTVLSIVFGSSFDPKRAIHSCSVHISFQFEICMIDAD